MKVYLKRGALNYKEKRLVSAIQKELELHPEKADNLKSATTFEELKKLHDDLCVTDAEVISVTKNESEPAEHDDKDLLEGQNDNETNHKEFLKGAQETVDKTKGSGNPTIDPFNDSEPIVNDYVMDTGFKEDQTTETKTDFKEPTSHAESFNIEMPDKDDEKGNSSKTKSEPKNDKVKKQEPINPAFNDMDASKKRKSTKKFAKFIVDGTCKLAEMGCIWYTTKDITEDRLIEYQLEDSMDLQLLLALDDGQRQPVIEWFRAMRKEAEGSFSVTKEEKEELIDSLYDVMLEKGIAPTPMQQLLMNFGQTFVLGMGAKAFQISSQINNVLSQLKESHAEEKAARSIAPPHTHTHTETTTTTDFDSGGEPEGTTTETSTELTTTE